MKTFASQHSACRKCLNVAKIIDIVTVLNWAVTHDSAALVSITVTVNEEGLLYCEWMPKGYVPLLKQNFFIGKECAVV